MPNLEVTYDGLWALYSWTLDEVERIESIEVEQRHSSDRLALPYLKSHKARLWQKITAHALHQRGDYRDKYINTLSKG